MTKENLGNELEKATERLLELTREYAWNEISNNCLFFTSEIKNTREKETTIPQNSKRNREVFPLKTISTELLSLYPNLYDVNLYVYHSNSVRTIVEIQYFLKSSLDKVFLQTVKDNLPMLHCKVATPAYYEHNNSKFDVNWQFGGLRHKWKLFWWKRKMKKKLNKKTVANKS